MLLLESVFLWLDQPNHFWPVVWIAFSLLALSALLPQWDLPRINRLNGPLVFSALLALALISFRWPACLNNAPGENPDESQMVAGAIALQYSPIFWAHVDGTTHGPLVQWPLSLIGSAGVRLDYTNARLFSVSLAWVVIVCTWLTLRVIFGDASARLLVLPLAVQLATTTFWDFAHYTSEHVPVALLAASIWLLITATFGDRPRHIAGRLGLAGLLLGAVPFAKLQGVPIGLWIGLMGLIFVLTNASNSWRERCRLACWLAAGTITVPLLILAMLLLNGVWSDFWRFYIESNLTYAREFPLDWSQLGHYFLRIARPADNFMPYFLPNFWLMAGVAIVLCRGWSKTELKFAIFTLGLLLVALYAVIAPNRPFFHYLQFLAAPLALATGGVMGSAFRQAQTVVISWSRFRLRPVAMLSIIAFLVVGTGRLLNFATDRGAGDLGRYTVSRGKLARTPLAGMLRTITRVDEPVAMWGWEPHHFVEANRRHATREAHTALQIYQTPLREKYRERYWEDLVRTNPPVFVDVVGPGSFAFTDRSQHGHETFPLLAAHIAAHYRLVAEVGSARVYARLDRVSSLPWRDQLPSQQLSP